MSENSLTPPLRFSLFFVFLLPLAPASKSVWLPLLRSCGPKRNAADPPQECKLRRPSSRRPLHSPHDATWCLSRRRRLRQRSAFLVQRWMVVSSSSDGSRQKTNPRRRARQSDRDRPNKAVSFLPPNEGNGLQPHEETARNQAYGFASCNNHRFVPRHAVANDRCSPTPSHRT